MAEQNHPRIAVAGDHSFAIVWLDKRAGGADIYMQRFDQNGFATGVNFKVNDDVTSALQFQPAIAMDVQGYSSLIWTDFRSGTYPFDPDVYYQRYDSVGVKLGANLDLTTELPDTTKEDPDISLSTWGTGVVAWADFRNGHWDIYAQLIASDGSLIGANFKVNDDPLSAQQHCPRVSTSGEGWFVVTWYDDRWGNDDVWVQRFDSLGTALGMNTKINTDGTLTRQAFPDVATDGAGHFTVVWVDWRSGGSPDIYSAKLDTSMVPVTENTRINTDQSTRAQREPAISADRMGNVGIIWSDSTSSSWDIMGQMIDVDGIVREVNFQANSFGDSAQLKPDIALDGNYRYITWVDRRNGNYDIYASITKYNDPSLVVAPNNLHFEMQRGQDLPPTQHVIVQHVGYNNLPFEVSSYNSWIDFTPSVASTPGTVSVSISDNMLAYGSYFGALTIVDTLNDDSVIVVDVRLDVSSPIMELSADTLWFAAAYLIDETHVQSFNISNSEAGEFSWAASEQAGWLELSSSAGVTPSTVEVSVNGLSVGPGYYFEPIVITAPDAMGSPDTVWIALEVINNIPFLEVVPDSICWAASNMMVSDTFAVVVNLASGSLNWTAEVADSWLSLENDSGSDGDTLCFQLVADPDTLATGVYTTVVDVYDSAAFNPLKQISVVLDFTHIAVDTVVFESSAVAQLSFVAVPVQLRLHNAAASIELPVKYDTAALVMDSVSFGSTIPIFMDKYFSLDAAAGRVIFSLERLTLDTFMAPAYYPLAEMYFTSRSVNTYSIIDTSCVQPDCPYVEALDGAHLTPVVQSAEIIIGEPMPVDDQPNWGEFPQEMTLSQNYPNPFNLQTIIEFYVPRRSQVSLEIFNILGQLVATPYEATTARGLIEASWDGRIHNGSIAPTGIYFYRLRTELSSLVKKMVLLK